MKEIYGSTPKSKKRKRTIHQAASFAQGKLRIREISVVKGGVKKTKYFIG